MFKDHCKEVFVNKIEMHQLKCVNKIKVSQLDPDTPK